MIFQGNIYNVFTANDISSQAIKLVSSNCSSTQITTVRDKYVTMQKSLYCELPHKTLRLRLLTRKSKTTSSFLEIINVIHIYNNDGIVCKTFMRFIKLLLSSTKRTLCYT